MTDDSEDWLIVFVTIEREIKTSVVGLYDRLANILERDRLTLPLSKVGKMLVYWLEGAVLGGILDL